MDKQYIIEIVASLVGNLVDGRYAEVYEGDFLKLLTVGEIEEAIVSYGRKLTIPPISAFQDMDIYETSSDNAVSFDFDLWFENEKGDLTLSGTVYNHQKIEKYGIENIHML